MRVLVTRPAAEAEEFARRLATRGLDSVVAPLTVIAASADIRLDLEGVSGLLFTSANAIRAFAGLSQRRELTAWCVGSATARAARAAGFEAIRDAGGDAAALAALIRASAPASAGPFLYARGEDQAGDLAGSLRAAGHGVREVVLYRAEAVADLPDAARTALSARTISAATFFSPRSARIFKELVESGGLAESCRSVTAYVLSRAVAEAASGLPWRGVTVAAAPNVAAMLDALAAHRQG
jgi:uroporphyrinogen-III synthase